MQNYKDINNKLYALDSDDDADYLPQGCVKITQAEADAINTPAPLPLDTIKADLLLKIDADIDAIYATVVGNRFAEYQDAALEAKAFKDAGYLGTAGASVSAWASVKAKTNTWAADDILATATAWKGAQSQMRLVRLSHKENARITTTAAQLQSVQSSWGATLTSIKTSLGIA